MNSQQVDSKKEYSLILESSPGKDKVAEQSKDSSIRRDRSQKVPVEVADQDKEDDDLVFRKMNIPWLPDKDSTAKEGLSIDSEIENLQKIVKQCKYQISFLNETNEGLVMTNRMLREDLDDINTHYQELIVVSKESLRRKKQTPS